MIHDIARPALALTSWLLATAPLSGQEAGTDSVPPEVQGYAVSDEAETMVNLARPAMAVETSMPPTAASMTSCTSRTVRP